MLFGLARPKLHKSFMTPYEASLRSYFQTQLQEEEMIWGQEPHGWMPYFLASFSNSCPYFQTQLHEAFMKLLLRDHLWPLSHPARVCVSSHLFIFKHNLLLGCHPRAIVGAQVHNHSQRTSVVNQFCWSKQKIAIVCLYIVLLGHDYFRVCLFALTLWFCNFLSSCMCVSCWHKYFVFFSVIRVYDYFLDFAKETPTSKYHTQSLYHTDILFWAVRISSDDLRAVYIPQL